MNIDCWNYILSYCDVKSIIKLSSVNNFFNKIIDDDNFWKQLTIRDFEDIHKIDNEKWLDYYKRRNINYGIPIIINNNIYQYNQIKQCISITHGRQRQTLILTKNDELYIINNDGFISIKHNFKVKKIYGTVEFYFVDFNDCLYKLQNDLTKKLLKVNVNTIVISNISDVFYTDNNYDLTYYINHGVSQRIYNFKILDLLNSRGIDYVINQENYLLIGKRIDDVYELVKYKLKASQLSKVNTSTLLILGLDGFVRVCRDAKFHRIKIPHVCLLGYNSFLTKNGELYYLDKTYKEILLDTNVINVSYVTDDGEDGCYVKRSIIL